MNPLKIANTMADAAQEKAQGPKKKSPKQVAAAKEQEKAKGQQPPQTKKPMPPQGM
jgi:hypothetical protein